MHKAKRRANSDWRLERWFGGTQVELERRGRDEEELLSSLNAMRFSRTRSVGYSHAAWYPK